MTRRGFLGMLAGLPFVVAALKSECNERLRVFDETITTTITLAKEVIGFCVGHIIQVVSTGELMRITQVGERTLVVCRAQSTR